MLKALVVSFFFLAFLLGMGLSSNPEGELQVTTSTVFAQGEPSRTGGGGGSGCIKCVSPDDKECQRVVSGGTTHIFYGERESC